MAKYGWCGLAGLVCDLALLIALHRMAGLHYLAASAIAYTVGAIVAFAPHLRRARDDDARLDAMHILLVALIGLGLTQLLLHVFVQNAALPLVAAKLVTAGFVFVFNFAARKMALVTSVAR